MSRSSSTTACISPNVRRTCALRLAFFMIVVVLAPARADLRPICAVATGQIPTPGVGYCGYDSLGADDEWLNHSLYAAAPTRAQASPTALKVEDAGEIAVITDNGTIVIPPNKFDLKKRAVLFTPDSGGYRISRDAVGFTNELGSRVTGFRGIDGQPGDTHDGYAELQLGQAPFQFFSQAYDRLFIGINGYITFDQGDTSARVSSAALARGLPRIAPLWTDLDASQKGAVYYNRLEERHLITWKKLPQPVYGGTSTFQVSLYDDGRIAFAYKKSKIHAALAGISPGSSADPKAVNFADPTAELIRGPVFEAFSEDKRLDLPALTQAFYTSHGDDFDTIYIWTDFAYDNGLGIAHEFNIRNDISGIGMPFFDRGYLYGSASRLASIITMGSSRDWPSDPNENMAGLNSAIAIVCHEQGHRWLAYVQAYGAPRPRDSLLGRDDSHWSFFMDTRTRSDGALSSLMEGNAWGGGNGVFTTAEKAVNYFSPLDQYLMGLRGADEVGEISYVVTDDELTAILQSKSPLAGFSLNATQKRISIQKIIDLEGPRVPDAASSPKEVRVAFVLLLEAGAVTSGSTLNKMSDYREALEHYFAQATGRRAFLSGLLR